MPFNALVANPGRLEILIALAAEPRQEFVRLRQQTRLTDGNLASHTRRLASAGLLEVHKQFRKGKPVTSFALTPDGRAALQAHVDRLIAALAPPEPTAFEASPADVREMDEDDDWVD